MAYLLVWFCTRASLVVYQMNVIPSSKGYILSKEQTFVFQEVSRENMLSREQENEGPKKAPVNILAEKKY
jgi:hypothetical protein